MGLSIFVGFALTSVLKGSSFTQTQVRQGFGSGTISLSGNMVNLNGEPLGSTFEGIRSGSVYRFYSSRRSWSYRSGICCTTQVSLFSCDSARNDIANLDHIRETAS